MNWRLKAILAGYYISTGTRLLVEAHQARLTPLPCPVCAGRRAAMKDPGAGVELGDAPTRPDDYSPN